MGLRPTKSTKLMNVMKTYAFRLWTAAAEVLLVKRRATAPEVRKPCRAMSSSRWRERGRGNNSRMGYLTTPRTRPQEGHAGVSICTLPYCSKYRPVTLTEDFPLPSLLSAVCLNFEDRLFFFSIFVNTHAVRADWGFTYRNRRLRPRQSSNFSRTRITVYNRSSRRPWEEQ